jgi:hypothetical protein
MYTGGSERLRIDTSGNLGIGTSTPAGSMQLLRSSDPQFIITDDFSSSFSFGTTTGYSSIGTDAAAITFKTGVSTGSLFSTGTERMRIFSSGGVSIGNTTDPGATNLSVTGTGAFVGGSIALNNGASNWLLWNTAGVAAPTFTTRSAGTKLVLYPSISASSVDYAIGIVGNTQWYSIPENTSAFFYRWYAGTTSIANLRGDGVFTAASFSGAGTGLTGTATSLSIGGNAATASALTNNGFAPAGSIYSDVNWSQLMQGFTTGGSFGWRATNATGLAFTCTAAGAFSAASYAGAGTGLTGTASSLSIGGTANISNYLNGTAQTNMIVGYSSLSTDVNTANDAGSFSIRGSTTTVASVSFHRTGAYAINMGLGTDNVFRIGGWSASSNCFQLTGGGAGTFLSTCSATQFNGSGAGLTGTASSLTAGAATSATSLNSSNFISRTGSAGNWNTDFSNTPAGTSRYVGDVADTTNNPGGTWWVQENKRHSNGSNVWGTQVAWGWEDNANRLATRNVGGGSFGAWVYYLNTSGATFSGSLAMSGSITANSDERLKKNWRPVQEDFVAKLANIKSGVYDRIDLELTQAGVSAQSLQTLLPESVNVGQDNMLNVAYGNAALVAAIELAKVVEELRAEIAELKLKIKE